MLHTWQGAGTTNPPVSGVSAQTFEGLSLPLIRTTGRNDYPSAVRERNERGVGAQVVNHNSSRPL
jgi:hypothetical protein